MAHLPRAAAREQLRQSQAMRIAQAVDGDDWLREQDRLRTLSGD